MQTIVRYGLALAAVAVAMALRLVLTTWLDPGLPPYITFYPTIMVVAVLGGIGPGLLATATSSLVACYWLLPPVGELYVASTYDQMGLLVYTLMGVSLSVFAEFNQRYRSRTTRVEAALLEHKDRMAFALESSNTGAWDLDLTDHSAHRSLRHDQIFGYDELLSTWTFDIFLEHVLPEYREDVRRRFEQAIATGSDWAFECRIRRRDGQVRWIWATGRHQTNDLGKPTRMAGIVQDITERKEAEEALRRSEQLYRAIGESINYGVWVCEADGRNIYASESFLKLIGITQQQCADFGWIKALHPEDAERTQAAWQECVRTGGIWDVEHRFMGLDGQWHPILARGLPIRDDQGYIKYWAGINLDISRIKTVEAELASAKVAADAANAAKSQFLANMSHEIRTPLGVILGFANLLGDSRLSEQDRRLFSDTIARNGIQLTELIDEILDLSRVETGKIALETRNTSLASLIDDVRLGIATKAKAKGVAFDIHTADVPASITTDPQRLRQILSNIAGNAVKFTSPGGLVRLTVKSGQRARDKIKTIEFTVTDTGIGIAPESHERIFEPFTQAEFETSRKYGGTGLGLTLSRNLARALGGDLVLQDSAPGRGTTFLIWVPAELKVRTLSKEKHAPLPAVARPKETHDQLAGLNVLLAEDSEENTMLLSRILTGQGALVDIVGNGQEAVTQAERKTYDAIVMDVRMPVMDGLTATRLLRAGGCKARIIALTANALKADRDEAIAAGCTHHLAKPFDAKVLIGMLRHT